jgi:acetyl esterase/lipase
VAEPDHLLPFVLPVETVLAERQERIDLYLPNTADPAPAIVFVPGGPIPADLEPTPRDWPVYRGYGSLAVTRGIVGVTVDHRLHSAADYPQAADDVAMAIRGVLSDHRVDADRIALWFFSGAGLLLADWLRDPPGWLRAVAASYPLLDELPGREVDPRFRPAAALADAGELPIVLTRVGRERPALAATVARFVESAERAGARLTIVDVPAGRHGFDAIDPTEESRTAVRRAFELVADALNG